MEAEASVPQTSLLPGIVTLEEWAAACGVSACTASRWGRKFGLPIIKVGHQRFIDLQKAREWLTSRQHGSTAERDAAFAARTP